VSAALTPPSRAAGPDDVPRLVSAPVSAGDRAFRAALRSAGLAVLAITGLILVFLALKSLTALRAAGFRFFAAGTYFPGTNLPNIDALLPDTILIAAVALVIAIPLGIAAAIYISEYAPARLRRVFISVIDLLAAIPSILFALWGLFFLMPRMLGTGSWLARHLGWVPLFRFRLAYTPSSFAGSTFIAGAVVSLMVIPIITALSRQVFSQAPQGEREAAYALGSTRWGMITTVVLPFGRAGVIGACMLGLGRALGETIAVSFILSPPTYGFNYRVLEGGGNSITAEIANQILGQGALGISVLFAYGLVLFALTLVINAAASVVIGRSRSGAASAAD